MLVVTDIAAGARLGVSIESQKNLGQMLPYAEGADEQTIRREIVEQKQLEARLDGLSHTLGEVLRALGGPEKSSG